MAASTARTIISVAKTEFVDGMHLAVFVAVGVVAFAAVVVFAFLPARGADHDARRTDDVSPVESRLVEEMDRDLAMVKVAAMPAEIGPG